MLHRWISRAFVLGLLALGGCPAVLDDNFTAVPDQAEAGEPSVNGRGGTVNQGGAPDVSVMPLGGASAGSVTVVGTGAATVGGAGAGPIAAGAGAGGAPDVVTTDPCAACSPAECCDGGCVDLNFDAKNCHECGKGCPGTTCDRGSCTNTCALGFIDCNHNVVDGCEVNAAVDPDNCGNCGITCGFQMECAGGTCRCPKGTADCDGIKDNGCETDTSSDPTSCGECRKTCAAGQHCMAGACACDAGVANCNSQPADGCEASLADAHSCGSCALDCGLHGRCAAPGVCDCMPGYLDCDAGVLGCETPSTDPNHCGSCSTVCTGQTPACDGTGCSAGCGALTRCGSSCVDTQTDLLNCGGCGKAVGLNQTCGGGKPVCLAGYGNCDANPNDCETQTDTDANNCGKCGTACKPGALCTDGSCGCAPATPNDCGSACQQCCSDAQCGDGDSCTADTCNGGVCGSGAVCASGGLCCAGTGCFACCGDLDCPSNKVCSGNQCVALTCALPQILCDNKCVNPTSDASNCGGCDNPCGIGRSCATSACTPKWVSTAAPPAGFVARERPAFTAMGGKIFIWGGVDANGKYLADGAIYDPDTNTWSSVGTAGAPPAARVAAVAVWTGSVVVVWGGANASADLSTGSRYDPATNTWTAMSTVGVGVARRGAYGFWTGSRVLVYGGTDRLATPLAGASLYDPENDKWSTASTNNQPLAKTDPTVGWTGSSLLVYGGDVGTSYSAKNNRYDVATNAWNGGADGPTARYGAFGTWDGTYLAAWGGASPVKADGKVYEPVTDKWTNMSAIGAPTSRYASNRQSGWSARIKPGLTLMLGGLGSTSSFYTDGGIYNSTTNSWTAVAAWPSGLSHWWGVGVWSGSEFVVWGGRTGTGTALTTTGERYRP